MRPPTRSKFYCKFALLTFFSHQFSAVYLFAFLFASKVQEGLFGSIEEANDNNLQTSQKLPTNFTVKVVQTAPKYRLPRTPVPRGGGRCSAVIAVHLTNFLSPQLFFLLYKHAYVERMLANIELLAGALPLGEAASALRRAQRRLQRRPAGGSVRADCQVGDLVLAPLSMHRFKSLLSCFGCLATGQQGQQQQQAKCIWARAEVVRLRTVRNQKTVSWEKFIKCVKQLLNNRSLFRHSSSTLTLA